MKLPIILLVIIGIISGIAACLANDGLIWFYAMMALASFLFAFMFYIIP